MNKNKQSEELTKYNLWANKRLVQWLESNNQEFLTKECQSSFSSILETINHIRDGQIFYFSVLQKRHIEKIWDSSIYGAYEGLISQSKEFVEYVETLDIDALSESRFVKVKTLNGSFPQYELIQHCMNHSTFHRGQIITMGHQLGLKKAPSTDMLFYIIQREKQRTTKDKMS